ncbi:MULTISPECIES: quaternary ammonium compound efflux SMR transporter SugE [Methylophaga]|uniref:Guanidinium exporter n=2 Tax=Methylophaga TaxID=40222 RepID=A0ABN0TNE9_9GAMM|nr:MULTISPECIES: SMR family transporter [Methylophaga]WVI84882.1 SMR family transporter [Methylophaga thalassica]BDZ74489.1 QacE family quaternary ammonium compound efflux SMR transporter [Methylophaga marina]GLP99958.1 QacE family quaternary ammonium compound efflux SMR transporter [Methylophaga thalassica]HIC46969.1 QacE family quaternary ammonium compound efflux SMR transporter [Methylophaga sp.]HIM39149.1 QacE family quaternary ammonium compound efflux SMR transporter [Methylophaga aminisu
MAWLALVVAGLLEVVWAAGLKYSEGLTKLGPSLLALVTVALSLWLLGVAMKTLPLGTAYGVWVGIGAIGTVIFGIVFLSEPATIARIFSILLILSGIIGLKISH